MSIIPVAEWLPDQPDLANGTSVAIGVIPRTQTSYGPIGSLKPYTTYTLAGRECFYGDGASDHAHDQRVGASDP